MLLNGQPLHVEVFVTVTQRNIWNRNKEFAEWIDKPEKLDKTSWFKASDLAWKLKNDNMRFETLRVLVPLKKWPNELLRPTKLLQKYN